MNKDLFSESELPFNLSGELIDNSVTSEGDARVRALAESEAGKAQKLLPVVARLSELIGNERAQAECRGLFD